MGTFISTVSNDTSLYTPYMDDILRDINKNVIDQFTTFVGERETNSKIPFLGMKITCLEHSLDSSCYTKVIDTVLLMNFLLLL